MAEQLLESPAPADEEVRLPDGELCEWVDGFPKKRTVASLQSSYVAAATGAEIGRWLQPNPIAWVFDSQAQYRCFPHEPQRVRMPDVSIILKSRMPTFETRVSPIAPDLAVEVVSPNDVGEDIQERLDDLRTVGTPLVWIVYLRRPRLYAHSAAGIKEYGLDDLVDAEPILPGFAVKLRELLGM